MERTGGKTFYLGLEEWVGGTGRKGISGTGIRKDQSPWDRSSFGRTGSQCPKAMAGAGYRWCSERRKGLAEAKLRGALTSRLFVLFLCSLPNLSRGTLGDIG